MLIDGNRLPISTFYFLNSCQFYFPDIIVWAYWNSSFQWRDSTISNAYQELSYS
jgi:hypothetical protein